VSKRFSSDKPIVILWEDEHYIAFFKPAGLLTVPADRGVDTALSEMVNQQYRARLAKSGHLPAGVPADAMKLHPCHRIDKETSGVILFAKGHASQEAMMDLFRKKEVHKVYIAFVHGHLAQPKGQINVPIKDISGPRKGEEKDAVTKYSVAGKRTRFSIVEVIPLTGRTNQIRLHFAAIGHPLVGESKFIHRKDYGLKFKRVALHAAELVFKHPFQKHTITVKAPLSTDMRNFLEKNRT
jgi:23S rRNA pseudouridine1911/1915/1917 synthase